MARTGVTKRELAIVLSPLIAMAFQWPPMFAFGLVTGRDYASIGATNATWLLMIFGWPAAYAAEAIAILIHRWLVRDHAHLQVRVVVTVAAVVGAVTYACLYLVLIPRSNPPGNPLQFVPAGNFFEAVAISTVGAVMGSAGGAAFWLIARPR